MENQAAKRPTVLVVEPDPLMLTALAAVLDSAGFRCFLARDARRSHGGYQNNSVRFNRGELHR